MDKRGSDTAGTSPFQEMSGKRNVHQAILGRQRNAPSRCGMAVFLVPHRTWAPEQLAGDLPAGGGDAPGVVSENQEIRTDPDRSRDGQ